jgi:replicative DNA helicase
MISEEMSALALGKRTIQYASEVPEEFWRHRQDVDEHIERHFALRAPVLIAEGCATTDRACKAIEEAVKRDGVRVVAVDYMQLLKGFGNDRFEQITHTSVALRQLANEHKILLIALVQLNREIEKRTKFIPVVSDIRECGQIEQDADAVVFVVWPHRINQNNPPHEYSFYVAKNRNRAINQASFKCRFEPSRQRFVECKQTTASDYFDAIPSREPGSEG